MKSNETIEFIRAHVPKEDLYIQLAEEASELAQAALKLVRSMRGVNPTPEDRMKLYGEMIEEYSDVLNVADRVLDIHKDVAVQDYKLYRWRKRIEEAEE